MSFAEIDTASRKVAAWLQDEAGIRPGDRVALMVPNLFAFPIAMLGIHRVGAAQVNVNPLYTPHELRHQLNDSGATAIVVFSGSSAALGEIIGETSLRTVVTVDPGDGTGLPIPAPPVDPRLTGAVRLADVIGEGAPTAFEPVALSGSDPLFLQYTGGTTGPSKGAVLTHRNLIANTEQFKAIMPEATVEGEEVVVLALPLYHIFGLMVMVAYMSIGARQVLIPNPRDMDAFVESIKGTGFTVIPGVNTMFQGLAAHPRFAEVDLTRYKAAVGGGMAVLEATSERWKALTGHHIKEGYGLSETSPVLCINPMNVTAFTGSCGLPVPSTDIRLLGEDGEEAPPGGRGEVCAKGPQVMGGYWNNDEANAAAFTEDGYFRTGDVGTFAEGGFLKIVDRKKDMVLVSGFNVYPNEIEAAVAACPGVAECGCIGIDDPRTGEAIQVYVVRDGATDLDEAAVIAHCRRELAAYKLPRRVVFIDALPKSAVGKILRRELRQLETNPA